MISINNDDSAKVDLYTCEYLYFILASDLMTSFLLIPMYGMSGIAVPSSLHACFVCIVLHLLNVFIPSHILIFCLH